MPGLPLTRIVLHKHGVGCFERQGSIEGDVILSLPFKQVEINDVLKSLTMLDMGGGHVSAIACPAAKPVMEGESLSDEGGLLALLPQLKGARVAAHLPKPATAGPGLEPTVGLVLGVDLAERQTSDGISRRAMLALLTDTGEVRSFDLYGLSKLEVLDPDLRRSLHLRLRANLAAQNKEDRTISIRAHGKGKRNLRLSYVLPAASWKSTYRILLTGQEQEPLLQGWAVIDNTHDEDWENVRLTLVAGLPVSFAHDLYTQRYVRRPAVDVPGPGASAEKPAVIPLEALEKALGGNVTPAPATSPAKPAPAAPKAFDMEASFFRRVADRTAPAPTPPLPPPMNQPLAEVYEYPIEHPVTLRRHQSALVPILTKAFKGQKVLLYSQEARAENPMRCVDLENTTGMTLAGGPVTVLDGDNYVGEALLPTLRPGERHMVPYAVELSIIVVAHVDSFADNIKRVAVRDSVMTTHRLTSQQTTYFFTSQLEIDQLIYLDHPRQKAEWQLVDMPPPKEVTETGWRFAFTVPPRGVVRFVVRQAYSSQFRLPLAEMSEHQLNYWLDQRYFDEPTDSVFRQMLDGRQQVSRLEKLIKRLQQEREEIYQEQKRIRENLQTLSDRAADKEMRDRFVRGLSRQEERLDQIDRESREHAASRDRFREQITYLLSGLQFEAAV
jgi:hypothetical protein